MNKARSTAVALAAALALTTTGCAATAGGSDEKITLTYWTHVNAPSQAVEEKLIAAYEDAHPNITIDYLATDFGSLPTKLNSAIAGGSGPDIFNYFQSFAAGLDAKGYLAPVDFSAFGVADQAEFEARYSEGVVGGFTSGGKIVGVPHEISTFQFLINNDSFTNAGLDPEKDFPATWDDVAKVGAAIQAAPGGPAEGLSLSLNSPVRDSLIFDAMARQAGQALFSDDGTKAFINSPEAVKALQAWGDFATKSKVNDPALGPTATTNAEDLFGDGTAGMVNTGGTWFLAILKDTYPDRSFTVGQYPTFGDTEIGADLYGFGLYVPVTSAHPKEAWEFARYLADNSDAYFTGAGVWLGDTATLSSSVTGDVDNWDVFQEGFGRGFYMGPLVNFNEISQSLENAIQRVVVNGASAQESLDTAQAEIEPLLAP